MPYRPHVDFGLKRPEDYKLIFVVRPHYQSGLGLPSGSASEKMLNILRTAVERCGLEGRIRRIDVETASQMVWTALHGVASLLVAFPDFPWVDRDQLVDESIENLLSGLNPA